MCEPDHATKGKRNTRSKRLKENYDQLDVIVPKSKKRKNYVTYPSDGNGGDAELTDAKNTLNEQNINVQIADTEDVVKKPRVTRRTRKFAEKNPEDSSVEDQEITEVPNIKKNKKIRKIKGKHAKTTSKKKKNKLLSVSTEDNKKLNKINISSDSFHSAAGSPLKEKKSLERNGKSSESLKEIITFNKEGHEDTVMNIMCKKETESSRINTNASNSIDITISSDGNTTTRKSSIKNSTFVKIDNTVTLTKVQKSTFIEEDSEKTDKLNTTFEKEPNTRRSLCNSNVTELVDAKQNSDNENTIKLSKTISLNSTYDKDVLNLTFDKNEPTLKSSLMSSDSSINGTFDKENSRISITSDDSKTENVINCTSVLIESSIDESKHSKQFNMSNLNKRPDEVVHESQPSLTTLKREGTFTKEGPEARVLLERTPTKSMSLPSPGFTPYRVSQGSQSSHKDKKSLLNVTKSIEKPTRSSLVDVVLPRVTRVMFCSPVNDPGVMTQMKKKIIKSSMKGSIKSFVLEDSGKNYSSLFYIYVYFFTVRHPPTML